MRGYPLHVWIDSDKKVYNIRPEVERKPGGPGCFGYVTAKPKYTCTPLELGTAVFDAFDYILNKYEKDEDPDIQNENKKTSWKKRGDITVCKYENGTYHITLRYVDHEIMTTEDYETRYYPADITAEEFGKELKKTFDDVFEYAKRQEIAVFYSEKEGLLFVPFVIAKTGYVYADYCKAVEAPYAPEKIREALNDVFNYVTEHPEDTRTNKERKEQLPWRNVSKYKSMHGFVKSHYGIQLHHIPNGQYEFISCLSFSVFDSSFVTYSIKMTCEDTLSDEELKKEIFDALERSRLITDKNREKGNSAEFWHLVNEVKAQTNCKLGDYIV